MGCFETCFEGRNECLGMLSLQKQYLGHSIISSWPNLISSATICQGSDVVGLEAPSQSRTQAP